MDATATTTVAVAATVGNGPRPSPWSPQDTANTVQASGRVHVTGLLLLDWTLVSASPVLLQFDAQGPSNMLRAPADAAHEHRPFTDAVSVAATERLHDFEFQGLANSA
eukprot:s6724_g4.t1